jgi:hypothetical protein
MKKMLYSRYVTKTNSDVKLIVQYYVRLNPSQRTNPIKRSIIVLARREL